MVKNIKIGINDMWTTNAELAKKLANHEDGYKYTQDAMRELNICNKAISNVCRGKRNSVGGFKWMFLKEHLDSLVVEE